MKDKGTSFLRNELKSMICVKSNKYEIKYTIELFMIFFLDGRCMHFRLILAWNMFTKLAHYKCQAFLNIWM